ncbi:hypothetical protein EBZ39_01525 [bacterium]|nr:hypothetical protein [bacterium]
MHSDQPWVQRLEYICATLFDNNIPAFARAIELDSTHLGKVFKRQYSVSAQLLAQVLSHTHVSADWLLWGSGPMLRGSAVEHAGPLTLPAQLRSSFPVFDTLRAVTPPCDAMPPLVEDKPGLIAAAHTDVASLIHTARSGDTPVLLFISAPAIHAGAGITAIELLRKKYVTAIATTGAGLVADIRVSERGLTHDLNYVARLAANQGLGYGEAVGRWAYSPRAEKDRSLLHSAYTLGVPATVHVELGEMAGHVYPDGPGAEIGAAFGAATYVDLLVFTEQVRQVCATQNGVVLLIGDVMRGLHLFLQSRCALQASECASNFHAVLIDNHVQPSFAPYVNSHSGTAHTISGTFKSNVMTLLNACDGVFSGQITKTVCSA